MNLLICISLGISLVFIIHSNFFMYRVSRGMPISLLWNLTFKDRIKDDLLYFTFVNLLMCRLCLLVTGLGIMTLAGGIIWMVL